MSFAEKPLTSMTGEEVASLRHALANRLNQIVGFGEILIEDAPGDSDGQLIDNLHQILRNARDLVPLVHRHLLDANLLRLPGEELYQSAQLLAARPEAFLQPFAANISNAAGELIDLCSGRAPAEQSDWVPPEATSSSPHGARLLVVDDELRNRELLGHQLTRQGYRVTASADGKEALGLLKQHPFDVVLLDVHMPGVDGFQVLAAMQASPALCGIPVIMISGSDEYESVIRCIEGGAEDYLPKPFDPVLLRARLKASLEKKAMRDEQRRRTEELEAAYANLRSMQDQLVVQEKLASLGSLAAGIAHEIKNPLNFVTNFAVICREQAADLRTALQADDRVEALEILSGIEANMVRIEEHGKRADRTVRGMLMHSRKQPGERQEFDLNALVSESVSLAYHSLRSQDITFNSAIDLDLEPIGPISLFPQDMSRVFLNLATNAFYAVNEKRQKSDGTPFSPRIRVTSRVSSGKVQVRVRDNGDGIPPAIRMKIFEPFFTTKPSGSGTGLGLGISHDIVVREHQGEISVESEEGSFAEFIVTLPVGVGKPSC